MSRRHRPTRGEISRQREFYRVGDPHPAEFRERTAQAIEKAYRSLAAGTLKHKSISAEQLALIFTAIASDLVEGQLEAETPSDDDLPPAA